MAKHLKLFFQNLMDIILVYLLPPALLASIFQVFFSSVFEDSKKLFSSSLQSFDALYVLFFFFMASFWLYFMFFLSRPSPVYLVDFSCFDPPKSHRLSFSKFMYNLSSISGFHSSSIDFQRKIMERSGIGDQVGIPLAQHIIPYDPSMADSQEEAELVIFSVVDALFRKTGVSPKDVDILVVNCSLFNPSPSLSSIIVERYKMKSDVRSFNLAGMGCSAGIIAISLAREALRARKPGRGGTRALIVTTEIISEHLYTGNEREMLVSNCLFRMGGAAILLSTRRRDGRLGSKYELLHLIRTHQGADDRSYQCVYHKEDGEGNLGVSLSKDLMLIAAGALKINLTRLAPFVLPFSEKLNFFLVNIVRRRKSYVPDFRKAFDHFCIHAGGRAVIEKIGKNLRLTEEQVEASNMTLHRMGNTSSSSPWYELGYIEAKERMKKGDRVWQVGLGSGFKCNSAVWRCRRTVGREEDGVWAGCIDEYPVVVPEIKQH